MSFRPKKSAIVVSFAAAMLLVGVAAIYTGMRKGQKQDAAKLILNSKGSYSSASHSAGPSTIPEEKRREIFERAIIAAQNVAELEEPKRGDSLATTEDVEAGLNEAVALAIRRIALGNGISEGEVLQIVREGLANDW